MVRASLEVAVVEIESEWTAGNARRRCSAEDFLAAAFGGTEILTDPKAGGIPG
jgi:hypothetical protein